MRIEPTVGRVVWFYQSANTSDSGFVPPSPGEPLAAIIAKVWNVNLVNLAVFDANGVAHSRTSVPLIQDDGPPLYQGYYCTWMPYQLGQAKKTEEAYISQVHESLQRVAAHGNSEAELYSSHEAIEDCGNRGLPSPADQQAINVARSNMLNHIATSVANVGQLVNYYWELATPPIPAKIVRKHSDLLVDVEFLNSVGVRQYSVPCVDYYVDGPLTGAFCSLCEPVSVPASGTVSMGGETAKLSE